MTQKIDNKNQAAHFMGVKIRCENWFWSRKVQLLLAKEIGCKWGLSIPVPWNLKRKFLVVKKSPVNGDWYFFWTDDRDFVECPLPEWSARDLVAAGACLQQ